MEQADQRHPAAGRPCGRDRQRQARRARSRSTPRVFNQGKSLLGTWGGDSVPDRDYGRYGRLLGSGRFPVRDLLSKPYRARPGRSGAAGPRRRQGRPPADRHVAALDREGHAMRIGIDFDNTIACYDGVFHAAALERGLIPAGSRPRQEQRPRSSERHRPQGRFHRAAGLRLRRPHGSGVALPGLCRIRRAARKMPATTLFIVSHKTTLSDPRAKARHARGRARLPGRRAGWSDHGADADRPGARVLRTHQGSQGRPRGRAWLRHVRRRSSGDPGACRDFPRACARSCSIRTNQFCRPATQAGSTAATSWAAIAADLARDQRLSRCNDEQPAGAGPPPDGTAPAAAARAR